MVIVLASSAVNREFEPWSGQANDYKIGMYCFSANHTALRRNSKDWFARNQVNVSEWGGISIRGLLFQWSSTIKIQLSMLVQYKADLTIISLKINLFLPWYSWKIVELALNNIHSIIRFHTLIPTGLVCLLTDNWLQCFILQRKINWKTCSIPYYFISLYIYYTFTLWICF